MVDDAQNIITHVLAEDQSEEERHYLARGRRFSQCAEDELASRYVAAFRLWVNDLRNAEKRLLLDDLGAEYRLRSTEPPHHLLKPELDKMVELVKADAATMSPDEEVEMGARLRDRYLAMIQRKN